MDPMVFWGISTVSWADGSSDALAGKRRRQEPWIRASALLLSQDGSLVYREAEGYLGAVVPEAAVS